MALPDRQVVLVAGAAGGIGSACAQALKQMPEQYETVEADRPGADVTQPGVAETLVSSVIAERGRLDGVVHAVGMSGRRLGDGDVASCTDEAWDEVLRVNLTSAFWLMRAALPAMADRRGGSFVAIGSVLADSLHPDFLTTAYAVSKTGLIGLAKAAALSVAASGVRVNVVAPALVDTPMARRAVTSPKIRVQFGDLMPLGAAPLQAGDVAGAVAWLLSDQAARVTGTVITVDGGWTLR
jgi:NAD(P)-dependent dehydrogenase (short-subunit alcohol dehydrogenase family)